MVKKEKSSNMTTILIILFVLLLIYFYLQSNSIIEPVVQSAGNIDTLENISRILKQF